MARFGKVGTQYFDDAGDPLISGKLYFYVTNTTTPKTTYVDGNLSTPNTNPVILSASGRQPSIFFNGAAKAVLTDQNDVQIDVRDPDGVDLTGNFDVWSSLTVYDASSIVVASNGLYYRSFAGNNQNNEPSTVTTSWEEVEFISLWNVNVTYALNVIVKGTTGLLYKSLVASNLGNNPVTDTANWQDISAVGNGGAEDITSAVDVELVVITGRLKVIDMTAAGKAVSMPTALNLSLGTAVFTIANDGDYEFRINDNDGNYLTRCAPGQVLSLDCSDVSTAAGIWHLRSGTMGLMVAGAVEVLNAAASTFFSIDRISDTACVIVWDDGGTNRVHGMVVNTDGANGADTGLTIENSNDCCIKVLSSTQMLLAYRKTTATTRCVVIDYVGNTLTPATAVDADAGATGSSIRVSRIDDTNAVIGYDSGGTLAVEVQHVSLTGSVPTVGAVVLVTNGAIVARAQIEMISTTKGITAGKTTTGFKTRQFSVSGSTVTAIGTILTSVIGAASATLIQMGMTVLSSSRALIATVGADATDPLVLVLLDISTDTTFELDRYYAPGHWDKSYFVLNKLDASTALLTVSNNYRLGAECLKVYVAGEKIRMGEAVSVERKAASGAGWQDTTVLTDSLAVSAGRGDNTYAGAVELEIGL